MNYGKYVGIGSGLLFIYFCDSLVMQLTRPFPRMKQYPVALRAAVVLAFYKLGENLSSHRYMRTNSILAGLYRNNTFTLNKESLARNFAVMNRKFTEEEREHFCYNKGAQKIGQRLFAYNPAIHKGTEEEEKKKAEQLYSGLPPYKMPFIIDIIKEENKERVQAGEALQIEPFRPLNFIDKEGEMFKVRNFQGFTHRHLLD